MVGQKLEAVVGKLVTTNLETALKRAESREHPHDEFRQMQAFIGSLQEQNLELLEQLNEFERYLDEFAITKSHFEEWKTELKE